MAVAKFGISTKAGLVSDQTAEDANAMTNARVQASDLVNVRSGMVVSVAKLGPDVP
jgi:hypothetical protein